MSMLGLGTPWMGYGAMSTMPGAPQQGVGGMPGAPPGMGGYDPASGTWNGLPPGMGGPPPGAPPEQVDGSIPGAPTGAPPEAPPGTPPGTGSGVADTSSNSSSSRGTYSIPNYGAKQAYNANPSGLGGIVYDPSLGYGASLGVPYNAIGYGNSGYGSSGGGYGSSGQDPNQLDAISRMGAAQAGAQGQIGAAQAGATGTIGAAQAAADASKFGATQGLTGTLNTNTTNKDIAAGNNATQLGLGGLNLQGIQGTNAANQNIAGITSGNALKGVQTTAADQLQAALAGINNQVPLQNAANAVGLAQVGLGKDKLGLASQLLTGGGVGGVGIGGGSGGAGGAGGTNGAPPLPPSQVINPLILQQAINHSQNGIQSRYDSLANNMKQSLGSRGFDVSNAAGGLPPGLQQQILQGESPELTDAALQWNLGAAGQNAQQGNTVASQGLSLYNAQQDRTLRQQLANLGLIGSLVS